MSTPIRMCISCRTKIPQKALTRLQCKQREIIHFDGVGRSFYLCKECIKSRDKRVLKSLSSKCKKKIEMSNLEKVLYG